MNKPTAKGYINMKKLKYLVLDCETAGNDFTMKYTAEQRKTINVIKSLIYDIGWAIIDRQGNVYKKRSFLVSEVFCVPSVFNTAYYAEKRPQYLDMLHNGEIEIKGWNEIAALLEADMMECNFFSAYNAAFDTRAISYTELYIKHLYSPDFYEWRSRQEAVCNRIANGEKFDKPKKEKDTEIFSFRSVKLPLVDIWRMSCEDLINTRAYKQKCLAEDMLSESGLYFKSSAETSYRYIKDKYDFNEAHMALDDALIEAEILSKIVKRKAATVGIKAFPFRELGTTYAYLVEENRKERVKRAEIEKVLEVMQKKVESYGKVTHTFRKSMENMIAELSEMVEGLQAPLLFAKGIVMVV